jgi:hypothetical protein
MIDVKKSRGEPVGSNCIFSNYLSSICQFFYNLRKTFCVANKYVDFVSDEVFEKLVKTVTDVYDKAHSEEKIRRNGIDPFKTIFDMKKREQSFEEWKKRELEMQNDKNVSMKIGYFHQKLLGSVKGWNDMKVGNKLDIVNDNKTIYIELKNKWNTTKGENKIDIFNKLKQIAKNKNVTAYYAYINAKDGSSGKPRVWNVKSDVSHPRVKEVWGKEVYKLVTGDADALDKTGEAVNKALKSDTKITKKWFDDSF